MRKIIIIVLIWLACGYVARAWFIGDFTRRYPFYRHDNDANVMYLAGPFGLAATGLITDHVWMPHGYTCEQRWTAWNQEWSDLGLDSFRRDNTDCYGWHPQSDELRKLNGRDDSEAGKEGK